MAIGIVIVTFNRLKKLKEALSLYSNQTVKPDYILVVNNASTDGTLTFLKEWKNEESTYSRYVLTLPKNEGGSGGFYEGLKFASTLASEWIWVSDDDAFPEKNALAEAEKYLDKNLSAICGSVINNGKFDLTHRRNCSLGKFKVISKNVPSSKYLNKEFEINCFSYVGTIINKEKLKQIGFPRKEYFIWYDDTEHSLRLHKVGKIMCIPAIRVHHNVKTNGDNLTWKTYYGIRNRGDLIKRHFSKKYFWYYCSSNLIKALINNILGRHSKYKLMKAAIFDAIHGKLGVNSIYKPGWKYY